ncbi:cytochrome b N-terminal domain-containing protein [Plebeiibacterium sediminum]|uniref:Cytochrome b N-terminal domain-containing protein n=1 Tax=Plebeiibacterium sediminum TaxID=2992112 RepID=A0AAE3M5K5_9BACT|nr:cytochrome b N-terminal domain-containing protein [Plebeiobacterium sediminum]MCW3787574.1 cytochrome b N-terminal domain-containing protein [Plebeiobacterium sediminum]
MTHKGPQNRVRSSIENFILHLHPMRIDKRAIKFTRTFGLGGISALLFVILFISGIILRFSYIPTVEHAYESIVELQNHSIFGQFIRNIHHLSGMLLVVVSFLHLIRVYYTQSIFQRRAKNWIYGLILLFLVLFSSFTGYLLPWDQLSFWAVTVITRVIEYFPFIGVHIAQYIRSGDVINGNTLLNFYNLHTGVIPLVFVVLMSIHFWLVRNAGGVALPKNEHKKRVNVLPNLVVKEMMVASIVIAIIFIVSVFYNAPLLDEANPLKSPNPTKAPWYFLGAQELLLHVHPIFSAVIIPIGIGVFFIYLPYFNYKDLNIGVWFNSEKGKSLVIQSALLSVAFTFILIYLFEHFLHFEIWLSTYPSWISTGVFPFLLYVLPVSAYLTLIYKKGKSSNTEVIMSLTTILVSSYITMLMISLLLRGKGMLLVF